MRFPKGLKCQFRFSVCLMICVFCFGFGISADEYVIGPDDVLDITVWKQEDLTKTVTVSPGGFITYPLLGELKIEGLTTTELSQMITKKLKEDFIEDPRVYVIVKEVNSKKVLIFGQVEKPGMCKIKGEISLLELLSQVGGTTSLGKEKLIVTRKKEEKVKGSKGEEKIVTKTVPIEVNLKKLLNEADLSQNITILPGDVLYVPSGGELTIYVMGKVINPGPYPIKGSITVLEAIKLAGGSAEGASRSRIDVVRTVRGLKETIRVNLSKIMKGDKSQDITLQTGDVVVVPESWF